MTKTKKFSHPVPLTEPIVIYAGSMSRGRRSISAADLRRLVKLAGMRLGRPDAQGVVKISK